MMKSSAIALYIVVVTCFVLLTVNFVASEVAHNNVEKEEVTVEQSKNHKIEDEVEIKTEEKDKTIEKRATCYSLNYCNRHGTCLSNGTCLCDHGYAGIDCSTLVRSLPGGTTYGSEVVYPHTWQFYYTDLYDTLHSLVWHVVTSGGDCDLYAKLGSIPSRSDSDFRDLTSNTNMNFTITPSPGRWYLGVYGYSAAYSCHYSVTAMVGSTVCPNDCSNNGYCNRTSATCQCYYGRAGADCSTPVTVLSTNYISTYSIYRSTWKYFQYPVPSQRNLILNGTVTPGCYLEIYGLNGGIPTTTYGMHNYSYYTFSTSFTMEMLNVTAGNLYLGLYPVTMPSWLNSCNVTLEIHSPPFCISMCSGHGSCSGSVGCVCQPGYYGAYCQTYLNSLVDFQSVTGQLDNGLWNYFHYNAATTNSLLVTLTQVGNASYQDCHLYVLKSNPPSLSSFDYVATVGANMSVTVIDAGFFTWYIGVYGASYCSYQLSVVTTTSCGLGCVSPYGVCQPNGECQCYSGYAGQGCRTPVGISDGSGMAMVGNVSDNQWNYFTVNVSSSSYLNIHLLESNSTGFVWLYVSLDTYPTLRQSDYSDVETNTGYHSIVIQNALTVNGGKMYYIGVYGAPFGQGPVPYQLSIWKSPF